MTREEFIQKLISEFMDFYLKGIQGKTNADEVKQLIEVRVKELADKIYGKV